MTDERITRLASETAKALFDEDIVRPELEFDKPSLNLFAGILAAALTDLARQIREDDAKYMDHKWPCELLGDGVGSSSIVPPTAKCTCGLDQLLTALRARTEEGS